MSSPSQAPPRTRPPLFRGKPLRRIQREIFQRVYRYPHRNLLAVGQPKSGSTWLYRMMKMIPGYLPHAPYGINMDNLHQLHSGHLTPPPAGYTVSKVHSRANEQNLALIHEANRPYTVLIRDPRDILVSWAHYVALPTRGRVRWEEARDMPVHQRIDFYIENQLPDTLAWALDWKRNVHPQLGLFIRYEDMLADTLGVMRRVFDHYEVGLADDKVQQIVQANTFQKTTGRRPGEAKADNFNRKGIAGDWVNFFSDLQKDAFKRIAQPALVELGYETTDDW